MTYQHNNLCFGETGAEQLSDGENSSCDLLCCVLVIVGSYPQHHHLDQATHILFTYNDHTVSSG